MILLYVISIIWYLFERVDSILAQRILADAGFFFSNEEIGQMLSKFLSVGKLAVRNGKLCFEKSFYPDIHPIALSLRYRLQQIALGYFFGQFELPKFYLRSALTLVNQKNVSLQN